MDNMNVDLPPIPTVQIGEDFWSMELPSVWKEILQERFPILMDLLENSPTYLAGGLLRTLVSQESLDPEKTDIDLFFRDGQTYLNVKSWFDSSPLFEKIFQCPEDKLTTYKDVETGWKYQCIAVDFYQTLYDVVSSFDFTTICFGTNGEHLVMHKSAIDDTLEKNLRWNKITYPASSLRRLMKYARKGFTMSESEYQFFVTSVWNRSSDITDVVLVYVD